MRTLTRLALGLLAVLGAHATPRAAESPAVVSERATVRLVSEAASIAPGVPFRLGLHQVLAPGWHTYWSNPGDAGAPATVTLGFPDGGSGAAIDWPAPLRIPEGNLTVFGYKGSVLLPITVTPPAALAPGEVFRIEAEATWLVCERICVPEEGRFELALPVEASARPDAAIAPLFAATDATLPRPLPFQASAGFRDGSGAIRFEGPAISPDRVRDAFFFPAGEGVLDLSRPQRAAIGEGSITLAIAPGPTRTEGPLHGVLVLTDPRGGRAAFAVNAPLGAVPAGVAESGLWLWQALLFALAGGLILNLMPCVFPILAIKAFALARLGGGERGRVRAHAASYVAGVVLSFLALGGLLLLLRAAGHAAGWGFQFTQPAFLAGMAWLMLGVGLNLSGAFAIGNSIGTGQSLAGRGGHAGSFATGALAVLVATPCTAPFMATALGAALVLPPAGALAVFAALGVGMAAPYGLLALFPGLAARLPKPGRWMEVLRQALAFPMYAAAAWLVWVLAESAGADAVLVALAGSVLVAVSAWLLGLAQRSEARWPRLAAALPVLLALALLPRLAAAPAPAAFESAGAWSPARVATLQAEGRKVFVNVTAAWCISCRVNEQVALQRESVQAAFRRADVAYLRADWTRADPAISALLRAEGRDGVPLYLVYPAGGGPPRVLPQLLTEGIVLQALDLPRLAAR
jgi:DsbC/DsbD-like thiol-disulfide interchange protein